jgi:hypothetical protein
MQFEQNVTECLCSGGAGAIAQSACESYCDGFGVPSDKSFLSTERATNDKCVCDGTSLSGNGNTGNNTGNSNTGTGSTGDGSTGDGSTGDGSTGSGSTGSGSTGGNSGGDANVTLDPQGYPKVPADALGVGKGTMHVSITESSLQKLGNGTYIAPYSPNASSANTVSFFDPGFIFTKEPVMQLQINMPSNKMSGTWMCKSITDMLVRYGNPPSGANQLSVTACSMDYVYEASNNSYTGKLTAELGDVYTTDAMPVPTQTAKLKAGFAFPGKE